MLLLSPKMLGYLPLTAYNEYSGPDRARPWRSIPETLKRIAVPRHCHGGVIRVIIRVPAEGNQFVAIGKNPVFDLQKREMTGLFRPRNVR
jgi:hypothetical protein